MCRSHTWILILFPWMCWGVFQGPIISLLVSANHVSPDADSSSVAQSLAATGFVIPSTFDAPFGSYPNMLNISDLDRERFHPVIVYPQQVQEQFQHPQSLSLPVSDCRTAKGMATIEQIQRAKRCKVFRILLRRTQRIAVELWNFLSVKGRWPRRRIRTTVSSSSNLYNRYSIGKYDENRVQMYDSDLFDNVDHTIDGYGGRRTVHLGMDLSAPVGTPIHAFTDGVVHSVGYNPDHGDYGYAIVIEHYWRQHSSSSSSNDNDTQRVWALYGHLDKSTVTRKRSCRPGLLVEKGQVIGRVGDIYENGGWDAPHVHFQLSTQPPDQPHDMPGASSVEDRPKALLQYPDPRYVLGPLY
jgi:peptidoglycan LD-endopeptidase LytH